MTLRVSFARPPRAPDRFSCVLPLPLLPRKTACAPYGAPGAPRPKVNIAIHLNGKKAEEKGEKNVTGDLYSGPLTGGNTQYPVTQPVTHVA